MFVTKCPCDECVPLIRGAGITHIYTTDQDRDKDKRDISYLKFSGWNNIGKFIVSTEKDVIIAAEERWSTVRYFSNMCFILYPLSLSSAFFCTETGHGCLWGKKLAVLVLAEQSVFCVIISCKKLQ